MCAYLLTCAAAVQAPLFAVALFGVHSVVCLAYGVATFRDCPEEAVSLQKVRRAAPSPPS